jgi:hypothetical protein
MLDVRGRVLQQTLALAHVGSQLRVRLDRDHGFQSIVIISSRAW